MLGHYDIGDYFWYTAFDAGSYFDSIDMNGVLKEGKALKSHEDILSVITYIHESYHLVQYLTLGSSNWLQYNADEVAISIFELTKKIPQRLSDYPLSSIPTVTKSHNYNQIEMLFKENEFLHDCIFSSKITDSVLNAEIRAHPSQDHTLLEMAKGLTGQDLLECHTAILTERHISWLIKRNPSAFSNTMLGDLETYFRVEKMESCQKVMTLFSKYVRGIGFNTANKQHPLYPACSRAAEYGLVLFALDYALHIYPVQENESPLPPDIQDVIPTIRFLKILGSIIPCMLDLEDMSDFVLNEEYLYTEFMDHLVSFNNKCNTMAGRSPSFLTYREITEKWQGLWQDMSSRVSVNGVISLFELFIEYRLKALELMKNDPLQVYKSNIADFALNLGFNPMFSTNTQVRLAIPYLLGVQEEKDGNYVAPPDPYEMTDTYVAKTIFENVSSQIFSGGVFCCPVAEKLKFYPCKQRNNDCSGIGKLNSFPQCFARQVLNDFYPQFIQP